MSMTTSKIIRDLEPLLGKIETLLAEAGAYHAEVPKERISALIRGSLAGHPSLSLAPVSVAKPAVCKRDTAKRSWQIGPFTDGHHTCTVHYKRYGMQNGMDGYNRMTQVSLCPPPTPVLPATPVLAATPAVLARPRPAPPRPFYFLSAA